MSHHALQRALVIALFDESFVAAMHDDPGILTPLGLSAPERAQLLAVDRRAFRTDPLRRRRTLRTLAEEFKAATTLVLAEVRQVAFVEGFFASPFFREAIAGRGALAPAFGAFLADAATRLTTPQLADVVLLEATTARCRRGRACPPRPGIALAPGVAVARFDIQVLDWVQAVERYLFELGLMPQVGLCADGPALPALSAPGAAHEWLLFTPSEAGVSLATVDDGLGAVLDALARATPIHRRDAARVLTPAGVPATRAGDLLDSLLEEGLLSEGLPPGAKLLA